MSWQTSRVPQDQNSLSERSDAIFLVSEQEKAHRPDFAAGVETFLLGQPVFHDNFDFRLTGRVVSIGSSSIHTGPWETGTFVSYRREPLGVSNVTSRETFSFSQGVRGVFGIEAIGVDRDVAGGTSGCFQLAMRFNRLCVYDVLRDGGVVV